jgi:hypothetical protein
VTTPVSDVYEVRVISAEDGDAIVPGAVPEFTDQFPHVPGYLAVTVPVGSEGAAMLDYRVEIALFRNGVEIPNSRTILRERTTSGTDGDDVGNLSATVTWGGKTFMSRLSEAIVYPVNFPSPDPPHHSFPSATPGAVMQTLLQRAVDRGALLDPPLVWGSFSPEEDSNGDPWANTVSMIFDAGVDLLQVLESLINLGVVEAKMVGRELFLYNPGGLGVDHTVSVTPVTLTLAGQVVEQPIVESADGLFNAVLAEGDEGVYVERTDAGSIAQWGRKESFISQGGVNETGTLTVLADAALARNAGLKGEYTCKIAPVSGQPQPFRDFEVGDWVWCEIEGKVARYRVVQLSLTPDEQGQMWTGVTLNDKFQELDLILAKRVNGITGAASSETVKPADPEKPPTFNPKPPTGLGGTSDVYWEGGQHKAAASLSWLPVTERTNGTALTVDLYRVYHKRQLTDNWQQVTTVEGSVTTAYLDGYLPGESWYFTVVAEDQWGKRSAYATPYNLVMEDDTDPPPKPQNGTVMYRLGKPEVFWSGGVAPSGGPQPPDYHSTVLEVEEVAGSGNWVVHSERYGPGVFLPKENLANGESYLARLRSRDRAGNWSDPSDNMVLSPIDLVSAVPAIDDLINNVIPNVGERLDNTIAEYIVEYAVHSSDVTPPVSGWSTSTPTRTPGTYIWYRTKVTYGDSSTSTSSPALLTGNDGAPGAAGTPAPVVHLDATTQVLRSPSGGGATTPATAKVTATVANTTITTWEYSVDGGTFSTTAPTGVSRTGDEVTVTGSTFTGATLAVRVNTTHGVSDTLTVAKIEDGADGSPGSPGTPGADAYTVLLTNEAHTFPGDVNNALAGSTISKVLAYKGSSQVAATIGTISGQVTGLSTSIQNNGSTTAQFTVTVTTALTATSGELTVPITVDGQLFEKKFTWSVARKGTAGAPGDPGAPAPVITLTATAQALVQPAAGGATTPATASVTGTAANTTITTWEYAVDGGSFTTTAPTGVSRSGSTVTVTGSTFTGKTVAIRASGGGVSDTLTVAKVQNGSDGSPGSPGAPGADAITAILTNESHVFPGDVANALAGNTVTQVLAFKGTTQVAATIGTITGQVTGLTTSIQNNGTTSAQITVTVTTALTQSGTLTIPLTIDGKTFTKRFSWSVSFKGTVGVAITNLVPYFRTVSTGSAAPAKPTTNPPVAPWATTEPAYSPGTELYRTELVTYSNGTWAYTDVTKVASYSGIDAVRTIAVTADGRFTASTAAPTVGDGANKPVGAFWSRYDGERLIGTWVWTGSAWAEREPQKVHIDSGTYGTLDGIRLKAFTILAQHIAVGDFTNYVMNPDTTPDPAGVDQQSWQSLSGSHSYVAEANHPNGGTHVLRLAATGGTDPYGLVGSLSRNARQFPVTAGEQWRLTAYNRRPGGGATARIGLRVLLNNGAYQNLVVWATGLTTVLSTMTGVVTIPAGAVSAHVFLSASGTGGDIDFTGVEARKMIGGVLIEDDAVTAPKISANQIQAQHLEAVLALVSRIVAGNPTGARAEMNPDGFKVYRAPDGDSGSEAYLLTSLGSASVDDVFTVLNSSGAEVASITSDGSISGYKGSFSESLSIDGTDLVGTLTAEPVDVTLDTEIGYLDWHSRGLKGYYGPSGAFPVQGTNQRGSMDFEFIGIAGRVYEITVQGLARHTASNGHTLIQFRKTQVDLDTGNAPTDPTSSSPTFGQLTRVKGETNVYNGFTHHVLYTPSRSERARFLLCYAAGTAGTAQIANVEITVKDVGYRYAYSTDWQTNSSGADGGGSPPATKPKKRYTSRWYATSITNYQGTTSSPPSGGSHRMGQGRVANMGTARRSFALFSSSTAVSGETGKTLAAAIPSSGVTIVDVKVRLSNMRSVKSAVAAVLGRSTSQGGGVTPTNLMTSPPIPRSGTVTFKVPALKNVSVLRGTLYLTVGPGSGTANESYAEFAGTGDGNSKRIMLEVTYEK